MTFCTSCGKEFPVGAEFCPNCGAPTKGSGSTTQSPISGFDALTKESNAQDYWLKRLVAFVIDAIIVYVVLAIIAGIVAIPYLFSFNFTDVRFIFAGTFSFVSGIILVFYFTLSETSRGATLGKQIMGLTVKAGTGRNPTFVEAFIRNISKIYWLLLLLDVVIGLATSREYNQKFSDRYMGTKVVPR